jgi:hypothetical protein
MLFRRKIGKEATKNEAYQMALSAFGLRDAGLAALLVQ